MQHNPHGFSGLGRGSEQLAERVSHQRHFTGQLDVAADENPAGPVGWVRELTGRLHGLHRITQRTTRLRPLRMNTHRMSPPLHIQDG